MEQQSINTPKRGCCSVPGPCRHPHKQHPHFLIYQQMGRAGNAPTLMAVKDLRKVAPMWVNVSHAIFDDKEAHEVCPSCLICVCRVKSLVPMQCVLQQVNVFHCHLLQACMVL